LQNRNNCLASEIPEDLLSGFHTVEFNHVGFNRKPGKGTPYIPARTSPVQQNSDYATGGVVSTVAGEYLLSNR